MGVDRHFAVGCGAGYYTSLYQANKVRVGNIFCSCIKTKKLNNNNNIISVSNNNNKVHFRYILDEQRKMYQSGI